MPTIRDSTVAAEATVLPGLDEYTSGLRAMLDQIAAERAEVEHRLALLAEGQRRLERALNALNPAPRETVDRPRGRPKGPPTGRPNYTSERIVAEVLAAIGETPQTVREIRDATGRSEPSVRQAIEKLREREQVRLARIEPGRGRLYVLMPKAVETEPADA